MPYIKNIFCSDLQRYRLGYYRSIVLRMPKERIFVELQPKVYATY
jgi:hypothetical protein